MGHRFKPCSAHSFIKNSPKEYIKECIVILLNKNAIQHIFQKYYKNIFFHILTNTLLLDYMYNQIYGAVVQLVRMPACHAGGREFKSRQHRFYI